MLTREQKWHAIGIAFLTHKKDRTVKQKHLTTFGLCFANSQLRPIPSSYCSLNVIICDLKKTTGDFWYSVSSEKGHKREYDLIRGDVAILFASMSAKDFSNLTKNIMNLTDKGQWND